MNHLQRKANYAYGICVFLARHDFDVTGNGHKQNKIMIEFLKEKGLPYQKWNWNYKGLNTADLINAETIQDHWKEFKEWILNKKET